MSQVFLIVNHASQTGSLEDYFKRARGSNVSRILVPWDRRCSGDDNWAARLFRQIADEIEEQSESGTKLLNAVAIVDLLDEPSHTIDHFNPIASATSENCWPVVIAMLVSAFPEIHWVFSPGRLFRSSPLLREAHTANFADINQEAVREPRFFKLHDQGYTALFDAAGLRQVIRDRMRQKPSPDNPVAPYVPKRTQFAASIDEESAYAYFNAYCAYRFGFNCHVVTSYGMLTKLFGEGASEDDINTAEDGNNEAATPSTTGVTPQLPTVDESPSIVFEDVYLKFYDLSNPTHLSDIPERDEALRKLSKVKNRIFVTVAHRQIDDPDRWRRNWEYLSYLNSRRRDGYRLYAMVLYKPLSGIFDLWDKAGLQQRLGKGRYKGKAEGYEWPPEYIVTESGGHSTHGRLLLIAERLITRAEKILSSAQSVPEAICGSILALEAQEYLGNRTPTTALEALALKHRLEVLAECMFYGVEYKLQVKSRFADIERELDSISEWFHPRKKYVSKLNAEISILREMVLEFRNRNQFDEEQECLAKIRKVNRHLWFERNKWWGWVLYPARWYFDMLLSSLTKFVLMLALWLIIFTIIYGFVFSTENNMAANILHGTSDAINSFIGLSLPREIPKELGIHDYLCVCVESLAVILGFTHLGIFISHLYSIIARR
jgi:hypothetical protein